MSNKLITKTENLPLKAYPADKLKSILEGNFLIWISDLLGLTGEEAAKRLLNALPAIEKHFWSLGIGEIKKAFTMYADGELITQPIPNYFTRILVGQIFKEYKQQKPKEKKIIEPVVLSDEEKKMNEILSATICFDYYIQNGYLNENSIYLYSVLFERKLFDFTSKEIEAIKSIARNNEKPIETQRVIFKRIMLTRFFDRLHAKGQQLKDVL